MARYQEQHEQGWFSSRFRNAGFSPRHMSHNQKQSDRRTAGIAQKWPRFDIFVAL